MQGGASRQPAHPLHNVQEALPLRVVRRAPGKGRHHWCEPLPSGLCDQPFCVQDVEPGARFFLAQALQACSRAVTDGRRKMQFQAHNGLLTSQISVLPLPRFCIVQVHMHPSSLYSLTGLWFGFTCSRSSHA